MTTLTRETVPMAACPDSHALTKTSPAADKFEWPGEHLTDLAKRLIVSGATRGDWELEPAVVPLGAALLAGIWHSAGDEKIVLRPQLFPLGRGVQLEWHAGHDHVEISIERTDIIGLFWTNGVSEFDIDLAPGRSPIPQQLIDTVRRITKETIRARGVRA